jgi:adenosylhomocysteine nucleosidase
MSSEVDRTKRRCSLLLFVATPSEEEALLSAVGRRGVVPECIHDPELGEYHWLGRIGDEMVIATRPAREHGRVVMGALGRLGSAARAVQFRRLTGAQAIIQLGMAFGVDPNGQRLGDVVVSSSLVPYDNRDVRATRRCWLCRVLCGEDYRVDYSGACQEPARAALVALFLRERGRRPHSYGIHVGAILSGAARINSRRFREELVAGVPGGENPVVGGEMEGVGLLAASTSEADPVWCIVKGISDFADEDRDKVIQQYRSIACENAAGFLISALVNDAARE